MTINDSEIKYQEVFILLLLIQISCFDGVPMAADLNDYEQKNIALVQRVISEVWNEKNAESIKVLFSPDYIAHFDQNVVKGLDSWIENFYEKIISSIPDYKLDILDITAKNDTVVTRWKATGTQQVELFGIKPSGNQLEFSGISWTQLNNLQLTETWNSWSLRDFLLQLLAEVKELREIVPICCYCKKIRSDVGYWKQVETYLEKHLDISLSHGICPECFSKLEISE